MRYVLRRIMIGVVLLVSSTLISVFTVYHAMCLWNYDAFFRFGRELDKAAGTGALIGSIWMVLYLLAPLVSARYREASKARPWRFALIVLGVALILAVFGGVHRYLYDLKWSGQLGPGFHRHYLAWFNGAAFLCAALFVVWPLPRRLRA